MSDDGADDSDSDAGSIINPDEELPASTLALLRSLGLRSDPASQEYSLQSNGDTERISSDVIDLQATDPLEAANELKRNGVVRLNGILSEALCNECAAAVNEDLLSARQQGRDHYTEAKTNGFGNVYSKFGNVDSKDNRWDMYLRNKGAYAKSIKHMLGEESSVLRQLFASLFGPKDASLYEFAALISDCGADSQRIHPDSTFQSNCALYTVFTALQDIPEERGPTVFIQGSHTDEAHRSLRRDRKAYLSSVQYHRALLRKGDVAIMDSRLLHCGGTPGASF